MVEANFPDPGAEDSMGRVDSVISEPSVPDQGYRFGDVTRSLIKGDLLGARDAGRKMAAKIMGTEVAVDAVTADQYPEDRMADEGGPVYGE